MIKLINYEDQEIATLLYDKHIPRVGDRVISDGLTYEVLRVIYDDDEDVIYLRVSKIETQYSVAPPAGILPPENKIEEVRRLAKSGLKLQAVKLYKELTGKSLIECKRFVDSLT